MRRRPKVTGPKRVGIGTGGVDERRKDGRFLRGRCNTEICFEWTRNEKGCTDEEACPNKRVHVCEWCRQPHRTVHCEPAKVESIKRSFEKKGNRTGDGEGLKLRGPKRRRQT